MIDLIEYYRYFREKKMMLILNTRFRENYCYKYLIHRAWYASDEVQA